MSIDSSNEGKLVYFNGLPEPTSNITDDVFGLEVSNKISLKREVQLFQWTNSRSHRATLIHPACHIHVILSIPMILSELSTLPSTSSNISPTKVVPWAVHLD